MEQPNQLVVIPLGELIALIEELFKKFLNQPNSPYNSHQSPTTRVLTRTDVANILQCTPNTVTKYIDQKKLHASVFNRQYRISEKELERFINQRAK